MGPISDPKHEAFAVAVAKGETQTKAYLDTFGPMREIVARKKASKLATSHEIIERLSELAAGEGQAFILTKEWVIGEMVDVSNRAKVKDEFQAQIRALENLGKEKGAFRETHVTVNLNLPSMSLQDLDDLIAGELARGITAEAPPVSLAGSTRSQKAPGGDRKQRQARTIAGKVSSRSLADI